MRILLVTPYYIPAWGFGGPVKVVSDLAQAFYQRGHQVTVVTTDVLDAHHRITKDQDNINGIQVHYFPNRSTVAAFRWNIYTPQRFDRWLEQHIHEFDVIHCHDLYTSLNITVSRIASRFGVPYFIQPHGALIPIRQSARFTFLKRWWLRLNRLVLQRATKVIASTEKEYQEIHQYQGVETGRLTIVPNGLSGSAVGRPASSVSARQKLGILPNDYVVVYFGRIQRIKGVDISIESLALLPDLAWKYIVVGRDDGQQAALESLAQRLGLSERIKFVGPKFGPELDIVLGISDVFLFNSRSESFPIAVLNACAAGLPVILSPECRIPEVAVYGAGEVLEENTPESTAAVLRQLLLDVQLRKGMSIAGMRLIREKFTLDRVVDQYLRLYK